MNVTVDQNQTVGQELYVVTKMDGMALKSEARIACVGRPF